MGHCCLVIDTVFLIRQSRKETQRTKDEYAAVFAPPASPIWNRHWSGQILLILAGLGLLVLGAHWPDDFDGLLKQADAVMYEVKHGGRNRIFLREF